ncbi:MAG TPA: SUMF1/EgtB/PvdO family nonheme iron enzyme [Candidatus Cloacimonadota bacterium]|nr:SUMF1/EgtB/PvdO family nonheme iron enzyme [Candidatus Cloacimonadota bacterium]
MKKHTIAILLLFLIVAAYGARKALVIGNADYTVAALSNPVNDVMAVEKLLKGLGFETTLRVNLNRRDMEQAIDSFAAFLHPVDEVVFYYSGHGAQVEGSNYLIPVGEVMNSEEDIKYDSVNANKVTDKLSRASVSIVVLDACRNNPFSDARSGSRGLALMRSKGSQFIIYSTADDEIAEDGGPSGLSPFTEAFVRHAGTPELSIDDVMYLVKEDLKRSTNNKQKPYTYNGMEQRYYLARADGSTPKYTSPRPSTYTPPPATQVYTPPPAPNGMVYVGGGSFMMGSNDGDEDEQPVHQVTVSSFWIGKYEVTQAEFSQYMQPGKAWAEDYGIGDNYPAYHVSWYAIIKYCNLRSLTEGLTPVYSIAGSTNPALWGSVPTSDDETWNAVICNWDANGYRLPTEAEWEFAARGGTNNPNYLYSGSDDINAVAWHDNNSSGSSQPVGAKATNGIGIFDMSGNLWEWCWDWYSDAYYSSSTPNNPAGPNVGNYRVLRGGSWSYDATGCRVSCRNYDRASSVDVYFSDFGFRLCRAIK